MIPPVLVAVELVGVPVWEPLFVPVQPKASGVSPVIEIEGAADNGMLPCAGMPVPFCWSRAVKTALLRVPAIGAAAGWLSDAPPA